MDKSIRLLKREEGRGKREEEQGNRFVTEGIKIYGTKALSSFLTSF